MTGNAINAKSEALELHELSSEELDAVSGGDKSTELAQALIMAEDKNRPKR
jgi:ABC-type enterochelin transport system ATPase subunit